MDFTCMTDAQIADYFKNATGKTCGRFNNTQLNRNIPLNYKQRLFLPLKYIAAWLMALEVTSFKAKASDIVDTATYTLPVDTLIEKQCDTIICDDTNGMKWEERADTALGTQISIGDISETIILTSSGNVAITLGYCSTELDPAQINKESEPFDWFDRFRVDFITNRLVSNVANKNLRVQSDTSGTTENGNRGVLAHIRAAVLVRRLKTLLSGNKRV